MSNLRNHYLFILLSSLVSINTFADVQTGEAFYWPSRFSAQGMGGTLGVFQGDGMVPLYGDRDDSLFFDAQAKYGNDQNWGGAGGLGYRHIYQDKRILGAYIFGDQSSFSSGDLNRETFWFVNPGIESLGNLFDMRVNGYIPVSSQQETAGNYSVATFAAHTQFNTIYDYLYNAGPGVDAEVGAIKIPHLKYLRTYVGGYYFAPKDQSNISGVSGRIEYPFTHHVALTAVDTYDNYAHNTIQVGLRFTIGGRDDDIKGQTIDRRMIDPINRNLATQYTGSDAPVVVSQQLSSSTPSVNNIYFFTSTGGAAFNSSLGAENCTFEHPCSSSSFSQTTVNDISSFAPNANLYFNPGAYSLGSQLMLPNGQSMFGRTQDYTQSAIGGARAQFFGGISLGGSNLLDSIAITNTSTIQPVAVNIDGVSNVSLNNVLIDSETTPTSDTDIIGINLNAANNISITNSDVLSNTTVGSGLNVTATNLVAANSQFEVSNTNFIQNYTSDSIIAFNGVVNLQGGNTANFDQTQIIANGLETTAISTIQEYALLTTTGDNVNIDNSQISVTVGDSVLALASTVVNAGANLTIQNSDISGSASSISDTFATQAQTQVIGTSSGVTTLINDQINASSFSSSTVSANAISLGIAVVATGVTNLTDSTLNIASTTAGTTSGLSFSRGIQNDATLNPSGTNVFNLDATGTTPTLQEISN